MVISSFRCSWAFSFPAAQTLSGVRRARCWECATSERSQRADALRPGQQRSLSAVGGHRRHRRGVELVRSYEDDGIKDESPQVHRAMSAYLADYIPDARRCSAERASTLQLSPEAWDSETTGTIRTQRPGPTLSWDILLLLELRRLSIRIADTVPRSDRSGQHGAIQSAPGYGLLRPRSHGAAPARSAVARDSRGQDREEPSLLSSYWAVDGDPLEAMPDVKLRAAFTDGHVETYSSSDVVPMKISTTPEGVPPYPDGFAGGTFFVPRSAIP